MFATAMADPRHFSVLAVGQLVRYAQTQILTGPRFCSLKPATHWAFAGSAENTFCKR
jgi:hypothetical protein